MSATAQTRWDDYRLFTWYRFESRSTKRTIKTIPFELFYVVPDHQLKDFGRLYEVFLSFKMTPTFLDNFLRRKIGEYHVTGMRRQDSKTTSLPRAENLKTRDIEHNLSATAQANISSGKAVMCVPVLAKKTGDIVTPAYILNRERLAELTTRHADSQAGKVVQSDSELEVMLENMNLYTNGEEKLPCAICMWGIRKVVNNSHCSLGTASCLSKIKLTGVDTFTEKAGHSVTPSDYVENPTQELERS